MRVVIFARHEDTFGVKVLIPVSTESMLVSRPLFWSLLICYWLIESLRNNCSIPLPPGTD